MVSDGKWLAGDQRRGGVFSGITIYSLESQQFQQLTDVGRTPVWLSDSRRILYKHDGKLYLVDSRSKKVSELLDIGTVTAAPMVGHFGISRDDRLIYFSRDVTEADIWMVSLE